METNNLIGNISRVSCYSKDQIALINAIEEARMQIESARSIFNVVSDHKLIDYAIYMEEAATARYIYLLREAKRMNLKVDHSYKLNNARVV
jgi:hypothetical protein